MTAAAGPWYWAAGGAGTTRVVSASPLRRVLAWPRGHFSASNAAARRLRTTASHPFPH